MFQSNTEAALQCEREVRALCEREEEERWRKKEDELLETFGNGETFQSHELNVQGFLDT